MKHNIEKIRLAEVKKIICHLALRADTFRIMFVLAVTNCTTCFTHIISFDFHNNPVRQVLLLLSYTDEEFEIQKG